MGDVQAMLKQALQDAYDKGYQEGVKDTEHKILDTLQEIGIGTLTPPPLETDIRNLGFPGRAQKCLTRGRINTLGQLLELPETTLLALTNFGSKSLGEVNQVLAQWGLRIKS